MASYLRPRRGRKSTAEQQNIILKKGEIFFEVPPEGVGKGLGKIKMGDGANVYTDLPYFTNSSSDTPITFTETGSKNNDELLSRITSGAILNNIIANQKALLTNLNSDMKNKSKNLDLENIIDVDDSYIYVSAIGSDVSGKGTSQNPYRTISRAIKDLPDTMYINASNSSNYDIKKQICIGAGTYNESIYVVGKDVTLLLAGNVEINAKKGNAISASNGAKIYISTFGRSQSATKYKLTINGASGIDNTNAIYADYGSFIRVVYLDELIINNCTGSLLSINYFSFAEIHNSCRKITVNNSCTNYADSNLFSAINNSNIILNIYEIVLGNELEKTRFALSTCNSAIEVVPEQTLTIPGTFLHSLVAFHNGFISLSSTISFIDNSIHKSATNYGGKINFAQQIEEILVREFRFTNITLAAGETRELEIDPVENLKNYSYISLAGWYIDNTNCSMVYITPSNYNSEVHALIKNISETNQTVNVLIYINTKQNF